MYPDNESHLPSKGNSPDRQAPSVGAQTQTQSAADEEGRLSGEECSCAAGLPTTTNSATMTCPECQYPGPGGWGMFPYAYPPPPMFCYPPPYLLGCPYHVPPWASPSGVSVTPSEHRLACPSRHLLVHTRAADTSRNSLCAATTEPEEIALNITSFTDSVGRVWTCTGRARTPPAGRDEPALPLRKKRTKTRSRKPPSPAAHAPRDPAEKASCNDLAKRAGPTLRPQDPRSDALRPQEPRSDTLRPQEPRSDALRPHDPRSDALRPQEPRSDALRPHDPRSDAHRPQDSKSDTLRPHEPRSDALRPQDSRSDALHPPDPRSDTHRPQDPKSDALRPQDPRSDALHPHDPRSDAHRPQEPKSDPLRPQDSRSDALRAHDPRSDAHRPQDLRSDAIRSQDPRSDVQRMQDPKSDAHRPQDPRSDAQGEKDPRSDAQRPQEPREEELWSSSSSSGTYDDSEAFDSLKLLSEAGVGEASRQSRQRSRDRLFRRKLGAKPCNAQSQEAVKRRLRSASPRAKTGDQQEGASTSHEPQWAATPSGRQRARHAGESPPPRRTGLAVVAGWPQRNADRPREENRHPPPRREPSTRTRRWHAQAEPSVAAPDAFPRYRPYEYARGHSEDVEEDGRGRNAADVFRRLGTVRRVVRCPQPQPPDEDPDGGLDFYRRPRSAITVSKTNYLSPRNRKLEEEVQRIQSAADDVPAPGVAKGGEGPEYPGAKFDDEKPDCDYEVDDCKRDPDMEDEED